MSIPVPEFFNSLLDGAVHTSAIGEAALSEQAEHDELVGDVYADLHAATGSLRMYPEIPEPRIGVLEIEFEFLSDAPRGKIWPKVLPGRDDASLADGGEQDASDFFVSGYEPLEGTWPCHEPAAASDSGYCSGAAAEVGGPHP